MVGFVAIFLWELIYLLLIQQTVRCKITNTGIKSFSTCIMMFPFIYNIYKIYACFPEELHQISLSEWTMGQLRGGMITFMMNAFQEVLGEKQECGRHSEVINIPQLEPALETIDRNSAAESLLSRSGLDSADKVHSIAAKSECAISDFLHDRQQSESSSSDKLDPNQEEIQLVELAPKVSCEEDNACVCRYSKRSGRTWESATKMWWRPSA